MSSAMVQLDAIEGLTELTESEAIETNGGSGFDFSGFFDAAAKAFGALSSLFTSLSGIASAFTSVVDAFKGLGAFFTH